VNFENYQKLVEAQNIGKRLPQAIYLHKSALVEVTAELSIFTLKLAKIFKIKEADWDVVKYYRKDFKISFLSYPSFLNYPYPPLKSSIVINLLSRKSSKSSYEASVNPPILHRREAFVSKHDPAYDHYLSFTTEGESIGLYENTQRIGFQNNWLLLIKRKGYFLDEKGRLQPLPTKSTNDRNHKQLRGPIQRHRTAISRDRLSRPMFILQQRGYFDGSYSIFDYGCGRGDDLTELQLNDINCAGWDPVHRPNEKLKKTDIVNLGFVINVIEDRSERDDTLRKAAKLAKKMLVVSAMLGNERIYEKFKPFKDGVITAHNTFQKYYTQGELKQYIESILERPAVAISGGVYAVFYDQIEEQNFFLRRQKRFREWRKPTKTKKLVTKKDSNTIFSKHPELLESFWLTCVDLGRLPLNAEFELSDQIRQVCGSHQKAFNYCAHLFDEEAYKQARRERKEDLSVYFALSFFNKRPNYSRMPKSLQLDVKEHFSSITSAREVGQELLFSLSDEQVIFQACEEAHKRLPASQLNNDHDFIFNRANLNDCPPVLRAYIGCATQLYGDLDDVSLIKAHILSGKVTLLVYDDFSKDVPLLTERIKIKLREQAVDYFDYVGEFQPQPLLNKTAFI